MQTQATTKNINLKISEDFPDYFLLIDGQRYQQILINLLSNAIKFSKENSEVLITYTNLADDFEKNIRDFSINVIDTGIGISEDDCKKLFT
jgi:signal transduction histidine kinase